MADERKSMTFRLPVEVVALIEALKSVTHLSATAVVITALREMAKREGVAL